MRFFILICCLVFSLVNPVNAAQGQFTKSPLVCFEMSGVAAIADKMVNREQIGALGFSTSSDILRDQGSCSYNFDTVTTHDRVIWLESPRWLLMLEVVDVGNNIQMWRPADIVDKRDWRLPPGCPVYRTAVVRGKGISPNRFLSQGIHLPWHCRKAIPRG